MYKFKNSEGSGIILQGKEMKKSHVETLADRISQIEKRKKNWMYSGSDRPNATPLVHDKEWSFLGLHCTEYWPGKPKPSGWSFLWHKWNWGFTLSYVGKELGYHDEDILSENATSITMTRLRVQDKPTFWQKWIPSGLFTFTIAKMCGKWWMTRSSCPFTTASLASMPLCKRVQTEDGEFDFVEIK